MCLNAHGFVIHKPNANAVGAILIARQKNRYILLYLLSVRVRNTNVFSMQTLVTSIVGRVFRRHVKYE